MNSLPTTTATPPATELLAFPASVAQQVFWYLELLQPGVTAFNVPLRFRLEGELDVALLERVVNTIVARHEVLRTHFEEDDGELLQIVRPSLEFELPVIDIRHLGEGSRLEEAERLARVEACRPFDLATGPLIRTELVVLSETSHILHVTVHHAVFDGWSMTVLTEEIAEIYQAFSDGDDCPLDPLPIQYGDVSVWQKEFLGSPAIEEQLAFWKRRLEGMTELELPGDRPRPLVKTWRGDLVSELLPRPLTDRLQQIAASHGATLYHLFLAVFKVLLHRYSGATDVVVGSPVTGRSRVELEPLIGVFINTLLLRSDLSGDPPFDELLGRVRDTAIEALEHQDLPFELLVRELNPVRDSGRNPLTQVNYTHQRSFAKAGCFGGVELVPIPSRSPGAIFDLHLFTVEREEGWRLTCDFSTDLFDRDTAVRMLGHFRTLLEQIADHPGLPISRLGILTSGEIRRIVGQWPGADGQPGQEGTVNGLFVETARRFASRIALESGERQLTYQELHGEASAAAWRLVDAGVGPGDPVALCAGPSPEAIIGVLGILLAGAVYVPIDPDLPAERAGLLLRDCGARCALVAAGAPAMPDSWSGRVVTLPQAGAAGVARELPAVSVGRDDPAYLLFTSGSTGRPKAVLVPHRAVVRLVRGCDFITPGPEDVFLQAAPLSFDASTLEIFAPLLNGGRLVVPRGKPGLDEIAAAVRDRGVTTLWLTAGLFEVMIEEHADSLRGLRVLLAGGDVLSVPHVRRALGLLPATRLVNGYGPTENTTFTTCHTITAGDLERRSIPIGRPIAGTTVFILDRAGQPVPAGLPGELHAGGDGLAIGYHGDPELTDAKFIDHPQFGRLYKTGDIGRWLPDGSIEFLGRDDHQAKVRGFRIEPGEIESVLAGHPGIQRAKVAIRGDGAADKRILAWVVAADGMVTAEELERHVRERLPAHLCPDGISLVGSFPLNGNGKIDVASLPDPLPRSSVPEAGAGGSPVGDTECRLAGIWRSLLEIDTPGRDDGFFELGGNSLTGLRLFSRIRREFGVALPLATLLQADSLRLLAIAIDGAERLDADDPACPQPAEGTPGTAQVLAAVQPLGELPPICAIHGGDGGILFYQELARRLPADRPFLAIESPDLGRDGEIVVDSVERTAASYVGMLRQSRPDGPYLLAGYSFGGVVAYEMARQLVEAGEEVPYLVLFDTVNPAIGTRKYSLPERVATFWNAHRGERLPGRLARLVARFRNGVATNLRVRAEHAAAGRSEPAGAHSELRSVQLREAYHAAMKAYDPKPYRGTLTLFRADSVNDKFQVPADYGWSGVAAELRIIDVPGEHLTIFDRENVGQLAGKFAARIPAVPSRSPGGGIS